MEPFVDTFKSEIRRESLELSDSKKKALRNELSAEEYEELKLNANIRLGEFGGRLFQKAKEEILLPHQVQYLESASTQSAISVLPVQILPIEWPCVMKVELKLSKATFRQLVIETKYANAELADRLQEIQKALIVDEKLQLEHAMADCPPNLRKRLSAVLQREGALGDSNVNTEVNLSSYAPNIQVAPISAKDFLKIVSDFPTTLRNSRTAIYRSLTTDSPIFDISPNDEQSRGIAAAMSKMDEEFAQLNLEIEQRAKDVLENRLTRLEYDTYLSNLEENVQPFLEHIFVESVKDLLASDQIGAIERAAEMSALRKIASNQSPLFAELAMASHLGEIEAEEVEGIVDIINAWHERRHDQISIARDRAGDAINAACSRIESVLTQAESDRLQEMLGCSFAEHIRRHFRQQTRSGEK